MFKVRQLDVKICDIVPEAENTETIREYITRSEEYFGMPHADINNMCEDELNEHIDFLDYMWEK